MKYKVILGCIAAAGFIFFAGCTKDAKQDKPAAEVAGDAANLAEGVTVTDDATAVLPDAVTE